MSPTGDVGQVGQGVTIAGGEKTAVVMVNLGGPDKLDDVEPFLMNLFSDPDIIRGFMGLKLPRFVARRIVTKRGPSVRENYRLIGGKSPQLEATRSQASALSARLDGMPVLIAMRYWHPRADETVAELSRLGVTRVLVLPCYPHKCGATTGSSLHDLEHALARGPGRSIRIAHVIESYADDPGYISALAETIREGLAGYPAHAQEGVQVLFSAHSLPLTFVKKGDPYPSEIDKTIAALVAKTGLSGRTHLSFQSKVGRIKWMEPSTEMMLEQLAHAGHKNVLVVPISFISDHIETLQEIDILYKGMADQLGITGFRRCRALGSAETFISALEGLVRRALEKLDQGAHVQLHPGASAKLAASTT